MITSRFDMENVENGGSLADRGKPAERSMEDLAKSSSSSGSYGMTRAARALTVRWEVRATLSPNLKLFPTELHIGLNAMQRRFLASLVEQVFRGIRGEKWCTGGLSQSFRFTRSRFGGKFATFPPNRINPRDWLTYFKRFIMTSSWILSTI